MHRDKLNININNRLSPEAFDELLALYRVPIGKTQEQTWQAIIDKLEYRKQAKVIPLGVSVLKVAASVALLLGLSTFLFFYVFGNVSVNVPRGSQVVHLLPDSSKVIINAVSTLTYNKNRWFIQRNVGLTGEAMFKVKKGSRFQVKTSTAITQVLGTVFNVRSRGGITTVSCVEGRVSVKSLNRKQEVILTKGEESKTDKGNMEKSIKVNYDEQKIAWTQGDFYFNNAPINSVIDELERQFDVDVFIDGDTNRYYTGYFNNKNINSALELICIPMNLEWQVNGNMIILKEIDK